MEIYLDNAATTQTDVDIAKTALAMMTESYGNPSSLHAKGLEAQRMVEKAREQVAALLDCMPEEVVFTSGGTEANHLAIRGGVEAQRRRGNHIVAAAYEHASVLEPVRRLEEGGFVATWIKPGPDGTISPESVAEAVTGKTVLVTCMQVNSETGAIAPIDRIAAMVRRKNKDCLIHCDAVQAFGKLPFTAKKLGVDLLTVSGHKLYAPKGCGALYLRKGTRILPAVHGGRQERGLRPGTENTALICAFGHAAEKARLERSANLERATAICEYFMNKAADFSGLCMNSPANATPYIRNLSMPGYLSGHLVEFLSGRGIYVSGGSACSGGARSHVLEAMGLPDAVISGAVRVSFSKRTTTEEIDRFFDALTEARGKIVHKYSQSI